ncbi:MAG: AAA family ATPase [Planctomycetia bacterium]
MIVELTIENFKSFRDPATISFKAGKADKLSGNLLQARNGERFVKSMALYGPNASGKTTVLDGLFVLMQFVLFSSRDQSPTEPIPGVVPYLLDPSSTERPSRIAATFDLQGDRFTVDVAATAERVWSETFTVRRATSRSARKSAAKTLIERTWNPDEQNYSADLHHDLARESTRQAVLEQTTPNRLMIGKLASMNNDVARRIVEWFDEDLEFYDMHRNPFSENEALRDAATFLRNDQDFAETVEKFMRDADTGVQALSVIDEEAVEPVYSESEKKLEFKKVKISSLGFEHLAENGATIPFRARQESSGTLRFAALLVSILHPSPRRRLVCIDEFSASMHPVLVRRLVHLVHSKKYNPKGSQIVFTTHDTHLMDPEELLRRDQITLCAKNRLGRSETVRLDEFQDAARSDANLQKQYLQGRFGGVPQFGPTLEDVLVDDEPLEA